VSERQIAEKWLDEYMPNSAKSRREFLTPLLAALLMSTSAEASREALRMDDPWPIPDILKKLADATEHLLTEHDCDGHGYEAYEAAVRAARAFSVAPEEGKK
jgi:hypothetical protein